MSLVVLGTGTGVGKTVTCAVLLTRYAKNLRLGYWKPVQTGCDADSDSRTVRELTGHAVDILPEAYAFPEPLSPHLAARLAGAAIDPERILETLVAHALDDRARSLVIEGVGGLLVPLTDSGYLLADLCRDMHLPCVLVAESTLGTINHTLLTLEAIRARHLELAGVVLSGPENSENRRAIERFGRVEVVSEVREVRPLTPAGVLHATGTFDRSARLLAYLK
jgi:dethiobiotin synthase